MDSAFREQPGQSVCSACELPLLSCWRFREDDQFCSLCERKILHPLLCQMHVHKEGEPPAGTATSCPDGSDSLWLYFKPDAPLLLGVAWERGVDDNFRDNKGQTRPLVHLPIAPEASRLSFTAGIGPLDFAWKPFPLSKPSPIQVVKLEPTECQNGILRNLPGRVHVVCPPVTIDRQALLLPWPKFTFECVDKGLAGTDGVLQIDRSTRVPLEMVLQVTSTVWVTGCRVDALAGGEQVELSGFGEPIDLHIRKKKYTFAEPVELRPGKRHPFRLNLDSSRWQPQQEVVLSLSFLPYSLPPVPLRRKLKLFQGSRISFGNNTNVLNLQPVQLGQVEDHGFPLEVVTDEGRNSSTITIDHIEVQTVPRGGDWLRVIHPSPERLPFSLQPGGRDQLTFQIDTRRLDRDRTHDRPLQGEIHLIDRSNRHWVCYVQALARRPDQLDHPLAFDWGTTNSCVAHRGRRPVPVPLDDGQKNNPELFPSDIYFKDISNRQYPIIEIGNEAQARALAHPECLVRSLKRKFQFHSTLPVTDERGQRHFYPLGELVQVLLRSLVSRVERTLEKEISTLHLSFPTKWSPSTRKKLCEVTASLEAQLRQERPSVQIVVQPPQIDEANAVAIQLLRDREARSKLKLPADKFHLIAYDFGGGTVDTSILEVTVDPETADVGTRYIGIGGREDFGGDEVTRAVMMLLHRRLGDALRFLKFKIPVGDTKVEASLLVIPMVPDGVSVHGIDTQAAHRARWGRQNWEKLWEIAELAKVQLSENAGMTNIASLLLPHADRILCQLVNGDKKPLSDPVKLDMVLDGHDDAGFDLAKAINFTLEEAWQYPLNTREDPMSAGGEEQFTVQERIEDTIGELKWQCHRAGIQPHVVVLAGGGCRLPLIRQKIREAFPDLPPDHVIYDAKFSKLRVAFGLAEYLELVSSGQSGDWLARSVDVIHHALGVRERHNVGGIPELVFRGIIPVGTAVDDGAWHSFDIASNHLRRNADSRYLVLYLQTWQEGDLQNWNEGAQEIEIGSFDLSRPIDATAADDCVQKPLPATLGVRYRAELRLRSARQIEMRVQMGGQNYGLFALQTKAAGVDLEDILQGPPRRNSGGSS